MYQPDAGKVLIDGTPVRLSNPQRARELGIAVLYQEPTLVPELRVDPAIPVRSQDRDLRADQQDDRAGRPVRH